MKIEGGASNSAIDQNLLNFTQITLNSIRHSKNNPKLLILDFWNSVLNLSVVPTKPCHMFTGPLLYSPPSPCPSSTKLPLLPLCPALSSPDTGRGAGECSWGQQLLLLLMLRYCSVSSTVAFYYKLGPCPPGIPGTSVIPPITLPPNKPHTLFRYVLVLLA